MICDHVGWFLQYKGYGTMGTSIFVGYLPEMQADNATCWMVISIPGLPCVYSTSYNHDREYIDVVVRGTGTVVKPLITEARDKILENKSSILHPATPILTYPIPSPTIFLITAHEPLREEYRDAKNRCTYGFTVKVEYQLLSSVREEY